MLSSSLNSSQKFLGFLGNYSYAIFITHIIILDLLRKNLWITHKDFVITHPWLNIILPVIISIIFGIFVHYLIEKPATTYFKKKLFPQ